MRRAIQPFTVEVRRRPRFSGKSTRLDEVLQPMEVKSRPTAFESAARRLAAAVFMAPKPPIQPSVDVAAPLSTGRILQSLVDPSAAWDPMTRAFAQRRRPGRPRKEPASPTLEAPCDLPARLVANEPAECIEPIAQAAPVQPVEPPSEEIAVSPEALLAEASAASDDVVHESGGPAPRPKAKRKVRVRIVPGAKPASPFSKAPAPAPVIGTDASAAPPSTLDEVSPPKRRRTIMDRYVFRNELKPGERWKRLAFKGRWAAAEK